MASAGNKAADNPMPYACLAGDSSPSACFGTELCILRVSSSAPSAAARDQFRSLLPSAPSKATSLCSLSLPESSSPSLAVLSLSSFCALVENDEDAMASHPAEDRAALCFTSSGHHLDGRSQTG